MHLLIPRVENSLRDLLSASGVIVTSMNDQGVEELLSLDRVLAHARMTEVLGASTVFDLRGLLVERTATNLRNRTAHGLSDYVQFMTTQAIYLWWMTLRLCMMPVLHRGSAEGDGLPPVAHEGS